jgi:2-methylcitrate dehydratase PrpD
MDEFSLDRRSVLRSGSVLSSLAVFGSSLAAGDDDRIADSDEPARTVEGGLELFATKWDALGGAITQTKFGRFVASKTFNCHVADTGRAYSLELGPAGGAALSPGRDPSAHATLLLSEEDWLAVLYGEYSPLAPALNGRSYSTKSESNYASVLGLVMFLFAHLPASTVTDPAFDGENLFGGLERRGGQAVDCGGGGPSGTAIEPDPRPEERVLGDVEAPDVTRELALRAEALSYEDLPETVVERVKTQIRGVLGVSYAATEREPGRKFAGAVEALDGRPEATAIAGDRTFRTSAERAAMVNCYLSQMLEWEDFTHFAHTGSIIVPTALAAAEAAGASGKEFITAVALGNEIAGRTGIFLTDPTSLGQSLPVHQTELPFVAGTLFDLDAEELQSAAGMAAIQPERTSVAGWASEAKGLLAASPARKSIEAVKFVDAGLEGRRDLLEHPAGLFYSLTDVRSPADMALAFEGLGSEWLLEDLYFNKRYASNGFFQAAIHAALDVREQLRAAGLDPADPATYDVVELHMNTAMAATGTLFSEGETDLLDEILTCEDRVYTPLLYEAYYAVAAALLEGELTHRQYREELIADPDLRALFGKIQGATDLSVGDFGGKVVVDTDGSLASQAGADRVGEDGYGAEYSSTVECIRGGVNAGFDGSDKLRKAAADTLSETEIARIDDAVEDLESMGDVSALGGVL